MPRRCYLSYDKYAPLALICLVPCRVTRATPSPCGPPGPVNARTPGPAPPGGRGRTGHTAGHATRRVSVLLGVPGDPLEQAAEVVGVLLLLGEEVLEDAPRRGVAIAEPL